MRTVYLISGILVCLIGVGVVLYQVSESCEDSKLANAYRGYPWCTDVLDQINLTFVGVVALMIGVIILALGGPLHWVLEPSHEDESEALNRNGNNAIGPRLN
jgi:hypothetical protein